jgi:hypothetical protein
MRAAVLLVLLIAGIANADPQADAAEHYRQGKAFDNAGQYDRAVAEYKAAHAIDKLPSHLFNIARSHHLKGDKADLEAALDYYKQYLAAEPQTARRSQVHGFIASATKQLADLEAKRKAAEDAARNTAEKQRLDVEKHVRQAEAYAKAGSWISAGDEYRAAADGGDVAHLVSAAEAYHKHPELKKAREAYLSYLDRVPTGATSDDIRAKVAELTTTIEKQDADAARLEKERLDKDRLDKERREREDREATLLAVRSTSVSPRRVIGYITIGAAAIAIGFGARTGLEALDQKSLFDENCTASGSCIDGGFVSDEANRLARNADILFGVGVATAVAGIVLVVTAPSGSKPLPTTGLRVVPTGSGAAVLGRF